MFVPTSTMCFGASARTRMRSTWATSGSAMGWLCSAAYSSMRASSASRGGVRESRYSAWVRWRILSMPAFMEREFSGGGAPVVGTLRVMGYGHDEDVIVRWLIYDRIPEAVHGQLAGTPPHSRANQGISR